VPTPRAQRESLLVAWACEAFVVLLPAARSVRKPPTHRQYTVKEAK
jgi:hypothetical protein